VFIGSVRRVIGVGEIAMVIDATIEMKITTRIISCRVCRDESEFLKSRRLILEIMEILLMDFPDSRG
jgi:hypothetical protein